LLTTI